jgi:radical SAM superfamily enzyme YgiQ (UPF0313 family)
MMQKKAVLLFFPLVEAKDPPSNYPWALIYLERMIRNPHIDVILIDERLQPDYTRTVKEVAGRIIFSGVSVMVGYQIVGALKFSKLIKSLSDAPLIWGGWFPTAFPDLVLNDTEADYICVGQGEQPINLFTEKLLNRQKPQDIPGINYKQNGQIINNPNKNLCNPNQFPKSDLSLIDFNKLIELNGNVTDKNRGADYLATVGCPNKCSFCNLALVFGSKWYQKPITEIIDDIIYLKQYANIQHLTFSDDNFFVSKSFVIEFCNALINKNINITWEANAHIGNFLKQFTDYDIDTITRSGCTRIKIGAESGDQMVLDLIQKNINVKDVLKIVKLFKKHKIHTRLFTMVCFPINPERDFRKTLDLILKAKLIDPNIDVNVNFYKPIPKTTMFSICIEHGFSYPQTINGLVDFFSDKFIAPWYKNDFHYELNTFLNLILPFTNPLHFLNFPFKKRPVAFIWNIIIFFIINVRYLLPWIKLPLKHRPFKHLMYKYSEKSYLESVSTYKSR